MRRIVLGRTGRGSVTTGLLAGLALLGAGPSSSAAQTCQTEWRSWGAVPGVRGPVDAVTRWDADGSGPQPARLVAAGDFSSAWGGLTDRIALWDGTRWAPVGSGADGAVLALTTWDPDGPGPLPDQLVAGGSFINAGGVQVSNIAVWNGSEWLALGTGMGSRDVLALTSWDPDGPGPITEQIVAGGRFVFAGGVEVNFIARWDGVEWQPLGSGMSDKVSALTTWDPDGPGPAHEQLVATGEFVLAGGVEVNGVARWDGSQWHALGSGVGASGFTPDVAAVVTWDPDGDGPLHDQLVVGGGFTTAGGLPADSIARWDGAQWLPVGSGTDGLVAALSTWDPDGAGPQPDQLVAGGGFVTAGGVTVNNIARWNGAQWLPAGTGVSDVVLALTPWDPDGDGPLADEIAAGGTFTTADGVTVNGIALWNDTRWQPLGSGKGGPVLAVATVDADGAGPADGELFAAGRFTSIAGAVINHVARWDGSQWLPLGSGTDERAQALTAWDPDGDGPAPAQLVVGGTFAFAGGVAADRVARWDGSQWLPLGSGIDGLVVNALTTWDPDADGPLPVQLVAGGEFPSAGGVTANSIARWDGTQWRPFGSGLLGFGSFGLVFALTTWDADGAGPLPAQLVAGGLFESAGGVTVNNIARWDGTQWRPLGSGTDGTVFALTTWDPDGAGPAPAQLVAGGAFLSAGGVTVNRIARWDGSQWLPFDTGMNNDVLALAAWDPDATGPEPAQLVASGPFFSAGATFALGIARWNGSQWLDLGLGLNGGVSRALTAWDPDGAGPRADQIVVGGDFTTAGEIPAGFIASWGCLKTPSCPGDWDGDGVVDFNDFLAFLNDFNLQEPRADINQDGAVDFNDLLAFLNFFNTPC